MHITDLTQVSQETVRATFEEAFSDYALPVTLAPEVFRQMIVGRDVSFSHSVGCFDDSRLVGFILCGLRDGLNSRTLYDAGTGVIPAYRGKHVGANMLTYLIAQAKEQQIDAILLEVLEGNEPAKKLYSHAHFTSTRYFRCFRIQKAEIPSASLPIGFHLVPLHKSIYKKLKHSSFLDFEPSWQNAVASVINNWNLYSAVAITTDEEIVAYGIIDRMKGDIVQLGAIDSDLYPAIIPALCRITASESITMINVDENSYLSAFLQDSAWDNYVNQYEMIFYINKKENQ